MNMNISLEKGGRRAEECVVSTVVRVHDWTAVFA